MQDLGNGVGVRSLVDLGTKGTKSHKVVEGLCPPEANDLLLILR